MTTRLARTAHIAALVGSAALGWCAHDAATPAAAAVVAVAPPPAPVVSASPIPQAPLIAVASDGNVTLRVEQQPLEWVLEQIALQSGRALHAPPGGRAASGSGSPVTAPASALPSAAAPRVDDASLRLALERESAEQLAAVQQGQQVDSLLPLVDP